jgi:hypothetical protein
VAASPADEKKLQDFLIKVATMVRLFASDKVGEAGNSITAFGRTLQNAGPNMINLIADRIEKGAELSNDEIKEIYDVAVAEVERKYKHAASMNGPPSFSNGHGNMPSVQQMVQFCFDRVSCLRREKDRDFILDVHRRAIWRRGASLKQQNWIEDLYVQCGGQL